MRRPDGPIEPVGEAPSRLPGGGYRVYDEWPLGDGNHGLRTELIGE